jgi:hypothetical protein
MPYHVAPRYTSGSPAMVDEATAFHVVRAEHDGYNRARSGMYGDEDQALAHTKGLRGIAYSTHESYNTIHVFDLMTDEAYRVPVKYWGTPYGHWYERQDTEQFKVQGGLAMTQFERRGKQYVAPTEEAPRG